MLYIPIIFVYNYFVYLLHYAQIIYTTAMSHHDFYICIYTDKMRKITYEIKE